MSLVEFTTRDDVALIQLNRPPVNALSAELVSDVDEAVGRAEDAAIRAVVIAGGDHFAAGADIKEFGEIFASDSDDQPARGLSEVVGRLESLAKPTIAAVRGYALGGGLELAMGADFRYLAEDARVGQPEIKLGIIPGAGGTQRLARLVGYQKAKELIFSGRMVGAEEALGTGLADKVFPADELVEAALADAAEWASGPTLAFGASKRAMAAGFGVEDGLAVEVAEFRSLFSTADAAEGVAAFIQKRDADFKGE